VVGRIAAAPDPSQTYALYLPKAYDPATRWPVLYVMDPRGRALEGLEKFREGAERHGWIVVSSWNTESDGPPGPNARAMNALLADTRARLAIDGRRLYLAGFSGTARAAWDFAESLRGAVAGIVSFGAGWPPGFAPGIDPPYDVFGGAGTTDFNYEEVLTLGPRLDRAGYVRRLEFYEGPHAWPPAAVCATAVEWLEIQAMRRGLRARDDAVVEAAWERELAHAHDLESAGRALEASEAFRAVATDYAGLRDVAAAAAEAERLARTGPARRALAARQRLLEQRRAYEDRFAAWVEQVRGPAAPPPLDSTIARLRLRRLRSEAAVGDDAARRLLAYVRANTAFYLPRDFMTEGRPDRALAVLEVAGAIAPGDPNTLLGVARARARMGDTAAALAALRAAASTGRIGRGVVQADPDLATLKADPGFASVLDLFQAPLEEPTPPEASPGPPPDPSPNKPPGL
jgi:tetratricopeptide (TPR) repeat protein